MNTLWRLVTGRAAVLNYGNGRSQGLGCNPRIVIGLLVIVVMIMIMWFLWIYFIIFLFIVIFRLCHIFFSFIYMYLTQR